MTQYGLVWPMPGAELAYPQPHWVTTFAKAGFTHVRFDLPVSRDRSNAAASVSTIAQSASFRSSCGVCHDDDLIRQQRLTRADWNREIDKMIGWGARLKDDDRAGFLDYLSDNFGPRPR